MNKYANIAYFLLRVVAGLLMAQHGMQKMLGWFGGMPDIPSPPPAFSQIWFGGVIELTGGLLVMLGLFTKCAAFILSGTMAVAYFQFHAPGGTWPIENHGEPAVMYCFVFLFIAAHGSGILCLDGLIHGKQAKRAP